MTRVGFYTTSLDWQNHIRHVVKNRNPCPHEARQSHSITGHPIKEILIIAPTVLPGINYETGPTIPR